MSKKSSKKTKKGSMSKNDRIKELEKRVKAIEKNMFEQTTQLSERNAALLRKMTA